MATCKGCKATIRWATTEAGKSIPLDPAPNAAGNIVITSQGSAGPVVRNIGPPGLFEDPGIVRYMPHHATCPNVADFRQ